MANASGPNSPPAWYIPEANGWSNGQLRTYKTIAREASSEVGEMPCRSAWTANAKRRMVQSVYWNSSAVNKTQARRASWLLYDQAWGHC